MPAVSYWTEEECEGPQSSQLPRRNTGIKTSRGSPFSITCQHVQGLKRKHLKVRLLKYYCQGQEHISR